ncbi:MULTISPECIES: hypothetical protein [unclassified Microbacterium]|uniref:hypothetical protein n=1 Tax=unclassified Microbacterium TaxID=2609290 RepID=UPI003015A3E3
MANISTKAFGADMIFRVPDDADTSGFALNGFGSRAAPQAQLDAHLEGLGYDPAETYLW